MSCRCPTMTAFVTSGGCSHCPHHGKCEIESIVLEHVNASLKKITIKQAFEIYKKRVKTSKGRRSCVSKALRRGIELMGLTRDTFISDIKEEQFDLLVEKMRMDDATKHGAYREETIKGDLLAWKMLDGSKLRGYYQVEGFDLTNKLLIDIDKYEFKKKPVQVVTLRQISKLAEEMVFLKRSGKVSDRNTYLYLFCALYFGMSGVDICNAKWNMFTQEIDGMHINYVRHKTGAEVGDIILPEVWVMLEDFFKEDEYIIERRQVGQATKYDSRLCDKTRRHASSICHKVGIGNLFWNDKTVHALRKFRAQLTRSIYGLERSASKIGDTMRTTNRNYAAENCVHTLTARSVAA